MFTRDANRLLIKIYYVKEVYMVCRCLVYEMILFSIAQ